MKISSKRLFFIIYYPNIWRSIIIFSVTQRQIEITEFNENYVLLSIFVSFIHLHILNYYIMEFIYSAWFFFLQKTF